MPINSDKPHHWKAGIEASADLSNTAVLDSSVLTKLNGKATSEDIAGMLPKFGWSVSQAQLGKATEFLAKADLITKG